MTKRCVICHVEQSLTEFHRRTAARDGLQSRCRSCARSWYAAHATQQKRYAARRVVDVRRDYHSRIGAYLLEHPCVDCGETDVRCLEFDHEDPTTKSAGVHRLVACGVSWQRVLDEIAKCSVRCSNCHQRRTGRQQNSWRQAFYDEHRWTGAAARLAALLPARGAAG